MPASVLVDDDDDEEAGEDDENGSKSDQCMSGPGSTVGSQAPDSPRRKRKSCTESSAHSGSARSRQSHIQVAAPSTAVGLSRKGAAFLSANLVDFCSIVKELGPGVLQMHCEYLSAALEAVKCTKGLPDGFAGDRFYASFNAAKQTPRCKAAAGRCTLKMRDGLAAVVAASSVGRTRESHVSVAATAGEVQCGNMGVEGMKKYCMIGALASFLHVVEQSNSKMKTAILIDQGIRSEVETCLVLRLMVQAQYRKDTRRLYEVVKEQAMAEDEWMYQLEEAAKSDPTKTFNAAMEQYFDGHYQEAHDMLTADVTMTVQHELALSELRSLLDQ
eukprot:TRINITY_DN1153_c0_g1_i1.p1 TRINITY_DN1153_c0_g1~~TRINITY_DN1153_c0_g1_i1.p1  ORF type:complete len:330 (+),score=90.06 TRINITY_DN1153_c0_g1_i1:79-1068(+)